MKLPIVHFPPVCSCYLSLGPNISQQPIRKRVWFNYFSNVPTHKNSMQTYTSARQFILFQNADGNINSGPNNSRHFLYLIVRS
jgi:hypothetical protein